MNIREDYGEQIIYCPLLKREIYEAYCYEINSVRIRAVKPEILQDEIDRKDMDKYCLSCKYCPL